MKKLMSILFILLVFDLTTSAQKISPWLFGQNHWMAKSDEGDRPGYLNQLWPKVKDSGIQLVRIGGNGYERRFPDRKRLNSMIDSIRGIGAEPLLQVPSTFSEKEAAKLVKDYRYNAGKGVRYYSIGNEPICNNKGKIDTVYDYLIRIAPAMKAADPTVKILVFDACTFYEEAYASLCGGDLDITGRDKNGNWIIDGFAFHNYPNGAEFKRQDVVFSGPARIAQQSRLLTKMIQVANEKHGRRGEDELAWALTEVNVTYINPNRELSGIGNPSFLAGQFMAEIYGIGMELGAFTIAPWCLNETDRVRTDFGYIGSPSEFYPRSSYYHTQMMALNMRGEFLPTKSSNSFVKTIGSISEDSICILILNRDQNHNYDFDLILNNQDPSNKSLKIQVDLGMEIKLSGDITNQTTKMYVLSRSGEILKQYTYGLQHNLKNLPPEVQ